MAIQVVQKFGGPFPTTPRTITPPALNPNDTRTAEERYVDQQWRDAAAAGIGAIHPDAINLDTDYA